MGRRPGGGRCIVGTTRSIRVPRITIAVQGPVPTALTSPSSPRSRRFRRVRRAVATAAVSAVALTAFGVTWQIRADDDAPAVVPQRAVYLKQYGMGGIERWKLGEGAPEVSAS